MEITLSRRMIAASVAVLVVIALLAGLLYYQSRPRGEGFVAVDAPPEAQQLLAETVRIAEGIGTGDFYLHPESYPLSDDLKAAFQKRPQESPLPYRGAVGHPVILLSTNDFVDTAYHISFAQDGRIILTQVQLRFQKVGGKWTVVRLNTYARGGLP